MSGGMAGLRGSEPVAEMNWKSPEPAWPAREETAPCPRPDGRFSQCA